MSYRVKMVSMGLIAALFTLSHVHAEVEETEEALARVENVENIDALVDEILADDFVEAEEPLAYQEEIISSASQVDEAFLATSMDAVLEEPSLPIETVSTPANDTMYYTYYSPAVAEQTQESPSRWNRFCNYLCCGEVPSCRVGSRSHELFPYIRANAGRGVGFECDYTTIGAMYSTLGGCGRLQPFIDFKWHCFTDRKNAANAGIGLRYLSCNCDLIYGANVYYDYRDGCFSDFHQLGLGLEVLSRCFEFHVNAYFPFCSEGCRPKTIFDDYIGDFYVSCQRCDFSFKGADAEAGAVLFCCRGFRVLLGAGAYYYNDLFNHHAIGARGRLNIRYYDNVGFDLYATTDKVFRNRVQGQFYICLPFSCFSCCRRDNCCQPCCSPLCCVACRPVYRNDMIVLKQGCCWDFNFDDTIGRKKKSSCGCH